MDTVNNSQDSSEWSVPIVVGIFAVMAFMAIKYWIPDYLNHQRARVDGQFVACSSFCREIGMALEKYAADKAIPTCPAAKRDTYSGSYQVSIDSKSFTFFCSGNNHPAIKVGLNLPMYNSNTGLVLRHKK